MSIGADQDDRLDPDAVGNALEGAVLDMMSERDHRRWTHVERSELTRPRVSSAKRRYFLLTLVPEDAADAPLRLFAKFGMGSRLCRIEDVVQGFSFEKFCVPRFHGLIDLFDGRPEGIYGIWDAAQGRSLPIADASIGTLGRLVRVAADMALASRGAESLKSLQSGIPFAKPIAASVHDTLEAIAATGVDVEALRRPTDDLARRETAVLSRIHDQPPALCHLDFGAGNVLFFGRSLPTVIDWDSAACAAPAATLRKLALLDPGVQEELAQLFARTMSKGGFRLDGADVLFTMRTVQAYYRLNWACQRGAAKAFKSARSIAWGLRNLEAS